MKPQITFRYICQPMVTSLAPYATSTDAPHTATWKEIKAEHNVLRPLRREWPKYAWPGGYPLYYITRDAGLLCATCANKNLKLTLGDDPQWQIEEVEVNYEDFMTCDNCNTQIEAAYDVDSDREDEDDEVQP